MQLQDLDEEARGLLRKVVEGQAYRQLMLDNIRGHGVRYLADIEGKLGLVRALETSLVQFREVQRLYAGLTGGGDVLAAVRGKMERIPYPASRMELAVCLFLCETTERLALEAYVECKSRDFAAIARTRLADMHGTERTADATFVEFCAEPGNRQHAQQMYNRWFALVLLSLGRPGSRGDARAVALGLRSRHVSAIVNDLLARMRPFLVSCGIQQPGAAALGLELPELHAAR